MADNHSKERMQAEAAFARMQDRPGGNELCRILGDGDGQAAR
ncbi:hypothetical protein [Methylobacterium sp. Leaf361]|nr:hypothetical protein [Methylobacterium sp. Leaf361]